MYASVGDKRGTKQKKDAALISFFSSFVENFLFDENTENGEESFFEVEGLPFLKHVANIATNENVYRKNSHPKTGKKTSHNGG